MLRQPLVASGKVTLLTAVVFGDVTRDLHSFTLGLKLSTFGTHSWVKLGYIGHKNSSS